MRHAALALLLFAAVAGRGQTARNATKVSRLPPCNQARQGYYMSVNDANPDCQTGSGVAGSSFVICLCDPASGWGAVGSGGGGGAPSGAAGGDLAGDFPNPTIAPNAVALTTDTTGNYAAGDAEAGNAISVATNSVALGTDTTGGYAASGTEAGAATSALSVTGFPASKCARFNGSGDLVEASGDCAAGDTDTTNPGTVTSVAASVPSWLTVANSPVTTTGTLAITAATGQTPHRFIGTCDTATTFGPCAIVAADLPTIPYSQISGAPAAGIGGSLGGDNTIPRSDGGTALQPSGIAIDDSNRIIVSTVAMIECGAFRDATYFAKDGCQVFNAAGTAGRYLGATGIMLGVPSTNGTPPYAFLDQELAWLGSTYAFTWSDTPGQAINRQTYLSRIADGNLSIDTTTQGNALGALDLASLRATPTATPPCTCGVAACEGRLYYDTSHALCVCGAAAWINLTPADLGSCG